MEIDSRVVDSFDSEERLAFQDINSNARKYTQIINIISAQAGRESMIDLVSAAIVIGLTAQFVSFLFGWVTQYIPQLMENLLLSSFMGVCVGVIAFALMKGEE